MNRLLSIRGSISMGESIALKVVSFLLALILWISSIGLKPERLTKEIRFEPLLPPGLVLVSEAPSHIEFTFTGSRVALREVERRIQPIRPDYSKRGEERTIRVDIGQDILGELPKRVQVVKITPQTFVLQLEDLTERRVPVKPVFQRIDEGWEVASSIVNPQKVAVSGPRSLLETLGSVATEPIDLSGVAALVGNSTQKSFFTPLRLDVSQGLHLGSEKAVEVKVKLRRK